MTTTELGMSPIYALTNEQVNDEVLPRRKGNYWYLTPKGVDTFNIYMSVGRILI